MNFLIVEQFGWNISAYVMHECFLLFFFKYRFCNSVLDSENSIIIRDKKFSFFPPLLFLSFFDPSWLTKFSKNFPMSGNKIISENVSNQYDTKFVHMNIETNNLNTNWDESETRLKTRNLDRLQVQGQGKDLPDVPKRVAHRMLSARSSVRQPLSSTLTLAPFYPFLFFDVSLLSLRIFAELCFVDSMYSGLNIRR